ncbi:MAG: hypothetical protein WCT31_00710 [Candidatus Micrarchaeia archaeon]
MVNTINVHAQFNGIAVDIIEALIQKGYASNRTEALRYALFECKHLVEPVASDRAVWQAVMENSAKKIWDNKKDDDVWSKY